MFSLSAGQCHDAPQGRKLIEQMEPTEQCFLLMDRAYEDDLTRELSVKQGFTPVVPPKKNRKNPWDYDKEMYKRRNEVERLFRRIKRFRRVFTRYEKTDIMFIAFITIALIASAIRAIVLTGLKTALGKINDIKSKIFLETKIEILKSNPPVFYIEPKYLDEFCYKFNRRYFGEALFNRLLVACVSYKNGFRYVYG